jgi:hypothetical protein
MGRFQKQTTQEASQNIILVYSMVYQISGAEITTKMCKQCHSHEKEFFLWVNPPKARGGVYHSHSVWLPDRQISMIHYRLAQPLFRGRIRWKAGEGVTDGGECRTL